MNGQVTYNNIPFLSGNIDVNTGANLEELTVTQNGTYEPSEGFDGFSKVDVDVPTNVIDSLTIDITSNGTYTPTQPSGVDGFYPLEINVDVEPSLLSTTITHNGTYDARPTWDGYGEITVDVEPTLTTLTTNANGTFTPQEGVDGFSSVTVNVAGNTYLCRDLPVTDHNGTYLGDVDITTPLTVGNTYMLISYWEAEAIHVKGGTFMVESGNTYISAGNKQFVVSQAGTKIRNNNVSSAGVAVSIMEIPDGLDIDPFV